MKKKRFIIEGFVLGGRQLPVIQLALIWLLMDKFHAPVWLWFIYWVAVTLLAIFFIHDYVNVEEVPVDIQQLLNKEKQE
jgi:hypothetical protein